MEFLDNLLLLLGFIAIGLLVALASTYELFKPYVDLILTVISVAGFLLSVREFFKNRR